MKKLAFLEYSFVFDPSETWSNGYQFENRLRDFFVYYGFEAQVIETAGGTGRRLIFITKMETSPLPNANERLSKQPVNNPVNPSALLNQSRTHIPSKEEQRFNEGRFLKGKGYLKR